MAILGRSQPAQAIISQGTGVPLGPLVMVVGNPAPRVRFTALPAQVAFGSALPIVPAPLVTAIPTPGARTKTLPATIGRGTSAPVVPGVAPAPLVLLPPLPRPKPGPPVVIYPRPAGTIPVPPSSDIDVCAQTPVTGWTAIGVTTDWFASDPDTNWRSLTPEEDC